MTALMVAPSVRFVAALLAVTALACNNAAETPATPTTPRTVVPMPETVLVQPGATGALGFQVLGPTGAPLPGAPVTFTIVDGPSEPAEGATLASASATTDAMGLCGTRVTAGLATEFHVRASTDTATAEVVVLVADGFVGSVDVAPFFPSPGGSTSGGAHASALATTIQILFFDNTVCHDLPPRAPPQPVRRVVSVLNTGAVAPFDLVSTAVNHAVFGRALDGHGNVLALGCADLPGSAIVEGSAVQLGLPLVDVGPVATGTFIVTTKLALTPPLAAAAPLAAAWRDLTDCALDPAQLLLDCAIDALGPASAADPLDCAPATTPGGDGAVGDALGALRGTFVAGPDGTPTSCRGVEDARGATSIDAIAQGLFGSPLPATLVHLAAAADDAAALFDTLVVSSMLTVAAGATSSDVALTHTLTALTFALPGETNVVPLQPFGLPVLTASLAGTVTESALVVPAHGFTVRLGTAARQAFGTLSLVHRGLPADAAGVVAAVAALAHGVDGQPGQSSARTGCDALDDALCARAGQAAGCLATACRAGLVALASRLDASFDAADGTGIDLTLEGQAPLLDTHDNGFADSLGNLQIPTQAGTWTVDLSPRTGRRTVAGTWEAIRGGD
jgi:hypothetical protein